MLQNALCDTFYVSDSFSITYFFNTTTNNERQKSSSLILNYKKSRQGRTKEGNTTNIALQKYAIIDRVKQILNDIWYQIVRDHLQRNTHITLAKPLSTWIGLFE